MLPNLLIIGAAKCGTTSLHRYLDQHPQISMSRKKELQVFARADWAERIGWYERQFRPGAAVRGESSPAYSMYPRFPGVPERIASAIPGAKLIYLVRDPLERLVAHYTELVSLHQEKRSLEDAIHDAEDWSNVYVSSSRYASQLDRYRSNFPDSQILVIDSDELRTRRTAVLSEIFSFLGVDPAVSSPVFDRTLNVRADKRRLNRAGWLAHRLGLLGPARRLTRRALPQSVRERSKALVARPVPAPSLDPRTRATLVPLFAVEAAQLRDYTGKPFATWSV